jgi:hypothetical protein
LVLIGFDSNEQWHASGRMSPATRHRAYQHSRIGKKHNNRIGSSTDDGAIRPANRHRRIFLSRLQTCTS